MQLIPYRYFLEQSNLLSNDPLIVDFKSGFEMTAYMRKLQSFVNNHKYQKGLIIWKSNHHQLVIWFQYEKWKTWFLLSYVK